ncbi:hypothetical protein V6N13_078077 [Hibiscus sabdariffa]
MAELQSQQYKIGAKACAKRKGQGFSSKCASLVKQQRARLYILRRCATLLLCCFVIAVSQFVSYSPFIMSHHANPVWFYGAYGEQEKFMATFLLFHQVGIEHGMELAQNKLKSQVKGSQKVEISFLIEGLPFNEVIYDQGSRNFIAKLLENPSFSLLLKGTSVEISKDSSVSIMAQTSPTSDLDFVDEFYFSALFDHDEHETFPPSDHIYAQELQFQEALMSSAVLSSQISTTISNPFITHVSPSILIQASIDIETKAAAAGESSSLSFCEICVERKESEDMFTTGRCLHSYCRDCISKHVSTRVEQSKTIITCPGENCRAVLELDTCRPLLPEAVVHRWEDALCLEFINASQRFYCPFMDCSAPLLNDDEGEVIRESECPFCHRLFCAQCYVPWHTGIGCEDFHRLNEDERGREDLMVRELAMENKWTRCPKCNYYVERTEGCPHMTCRCNFEFCYGCGEEWTTSHGGCQRN